MSAGEPKSVLVLSHGDGRSPHLTPKTLPPGSEGRFQPPSFWNTYLGVWLTGLAVVGVQAGLIGLLLLQRRRMGRAEEELSASQRMLRTVLDTIPHRVIWKDRNGVILGCNRAVLDECGDIIGKTDFETGAAKYAKQYRADDLAVMETNQPRLNFEEPQTRPDSSQGWYRTSKVPLHDNDGKVIGVLGTYEDITELKRAEEELRGKTALLEAQLNSSIEGILVVDNEGKKVIQNQRTVDLWKIPAEIVNENNDEKQVQFVMSQTKNPEQFVEKVSYLYSHPDEISRDEIELKDGTILDRYSSPVIGKNGRRYGRIWSFHDITELKQAEEALRESERRQRTLAGATFEGICVSENGRILDVNDQFAAMLGCERKELIGRELLTLIAPEWRPVMAERIQSGAGDAFEHQCLRKDGSLFECEAQARSISWGDRKVRVSAVRDLTQRKQLEAQLRQSQKMEAFGQLAAGVAHDFNNILTVIQGNVSLLQMEVTPVEQGNANSEIFHAAERAANLTRQLLTFSRRQPMQAKDLDLNEVVANVTKMLQRLIGEDIALETHYMPGEAFIHADPGMMEQVLMNLAVNARDAMPKGGRLIVETVPITLADTTRFTKHTARPGEFIRLSVTDTGCGIPQEHLNHLFEPFFTTKEIGKGTGLGLATVFGIIQQHQGWIETESQLNQGAAFHIYLPRLARKTLERQRPILPPNTSQGTETILLVEDETVLRQLMQRVLERHGYHIYAAVSGVQALEVWREHGDEVDVLVTDMVMPEGMTGRELADQLRTKNPGLKVIYCSGYANGMPGKDLPLRENEDFLEKPFEPVKLLQRIRACVDVTG